MALPLNMHPTGLTFPSTEFKRALTFVDRSDRGTERHLLLHPADSLISSLSTGLSAQNEAAEITFSPPKPTGAFLFS